MGAFFVVLVWLVASSIQSALILYVNRNELLLLLLEATVGTL